MTESTLTTLMRWLDRLERRAQWWKHTGTLVLALAVSGMLVGHVQPKSRTVEAEEFLLKDPSGRLRGRFVVVHDTVELALFDKDGKIRVLQSVLADGSASLNFRDMAGKDRAALGTAADGAPGLGFIDQDGKPRVALVVAGGLSILGLYDRDGEQRATLLLMRDGTPQLALKDKTGKVIWEAP